MKTVAEVSRIAGVSVRALHHYDAIGLLRPARVTQAGYRLYDEGCLQRLQLILLFRELEFPLKEIARILDQPGFDVTQALEQQIALLELKRQRLDTLIAHARNIHRSGGIHMDFKAFDAAKLEQYTQEAKKRWGETDAWKESRQKTAGKSSQELLSDSDALMDIFRELGSLQGTDPASEPVRKLVEKLQSFITDRYYNCTPEILRGLGQLYVAGGELTDNINRAGGAHTAEFVRQAIENYCG